MVVAAFSFLCGSKLHTLEPICEMLRCPIFLVNRNAANYVLSTDPVLCP